jgi:hypothetical protein
LLLGDVLTFLTLLNVDDVAPRGPRRLPPTALVKLDQQLAVPDQLKSPMLSHRGGKHGPTELETDRIRLIHFLCEASGLVALTGKLLKPTPRAAAWLKASPHERAAQLFDAAFPPQPDRVLDRLWRVYHLPGWELRSPTSTTTKLLDLMRQMRRDERLKLKTIHRLVPLDVGDAAPIWPGLLTYLEWFGVIEWCERRSAIRLTQAGATLLKRADAPPLLSPPQSGEDRRSMRFAVRSKRSVNLDLIASPKVDWMVLYELAEYAELLPSKDGRRRYRLDAARMRRALEHGNSLDHVQEFLASATGKPLPPAVSDWLKEQARQVSRVRLSRVTLLEVDDPDLLTELTREQRIRAGIDRTLSPRAMTVREHRLPALLRRLERRGVIPRVEFSLLPPGRRAALPKATRDEGQSPANRLFDQPSQAHLYLSLRLGYELSDLIPSACRAPYSLLLDLERQLSARDRDVAIELARECAQTILQPPQSLPPTIEDRLPVLVSETVAHIERAIREGVPLKIVYYSPYRDEVTTRLVEPHRLEWRGRTPYLIAYCTLDQDERTFRVDRIRRMTKVK